MLETEEVDDDYFTPVAKTSLASIFKQRISSEKSQNDTLKYSPPMAKPTQSPENPQKKTIHECIFSCVLNAYLWLDNVYTPKGKLGCAVVRVTTDRSLNFHSILLYDSKKATVSSVTATKELEIILQGKYYISYYDQYQKYWCLYGSEDDIKKIIDIVKTCDVNLKVLKESDNFLPEKNNVADVKINTNMKDIESDTDSSINRKTKASILNRMANMGQSVLPPHVISKEQTSDSSDTNESENHLISIRHKPVKSIVKKSIAEKNALDQYQKSDAPKKTIVPNNIQHSKENKTCMIVSEQLMAPQGSSANTSTSSTDLIYFITEQRIANSELRMNMTRIADKVDTILRKVNNCNINDNCGTFNINNNILNKLLQEYEIKIRNYESFIATLDMTNLSQRAPPSNELFENKHETLVNNTNVMLMDKITELENCIKEKDKCILSYSDEIKILKEAKSSSQNKVELQAKLTEYELELSRNQKKIAKLKHEKNELITNHDDQIEQKVKSIMNDTFRAIEINFDDDDTYLGTTIKSIVATVIKKVTMDSLGQSK